jgi:hypothetical protein
MGIEQISSQFYVVRYDEKDHTRFQIVDGPFPDKAQAISMARLRDIT